VIINHFSFMEVLNMDNQVREQRSINYAFKIVGYLGHDNKLFDRTCPTCQKGMYSSREVTRCPKCGGALSYLTNAEGKALAISEGTVYPAFGPKQEKRDIEAVAKRKNGMLPMYRFKMFSFMDEHGVLIPPPEHGRCRKGAKVEILTMNHQLVPSWFQTKENTVKVELLIMVYTNYGDYVKVLTAQEYASKTVSHNVYPDGTPVPMTAQEDRIAYLERQIAELRGATAPTAPPAPQPPVQETLPWEGQNQMTAAADNSVDPFANAQ
jgi:hypothetical protein